MTTFNPELTIKKLSPELEQGPDWLLEQRHAARDSFNAAPLPRRGLHLWRYTDPSRFMIERTGEAQLTEDAFGTVEKIEREHLAEGHLSALVIANAGREINISGVEQYEQMGLTILPLSQAVESHFELVRDHLYKLVNNASGKFEAMNGALWQDGIFVHVKKGAVIDRPVHLLRRAAAGGSVQYPRLLVVIEEGAELTIVDEYGGGALKGDEGVSYCNSAVELFAKQNSRMRYVSLQRQNAGTHNYLAHRAEVEQGATMLTVPLAFGASLSKQNFGVKLTGPGADSKMYGLLFGSGRQHFDNHTLHHHAHGQTTSDIDFKVVLRDKAISAYTGLIRIEEHAKTCEAYQENRNLLLNKGPKAETIPELEILNEDVSCSHGATVGPIDPNMIFYLNSRGIPNDEAVKIIVSGFVASTLAMAPADLRERLSRFVAERLGID